MNLEQICSLYQPLVALSERPVILYGAGLFAKSAIAYCENLGYPPVALCDGSQEKIGKELYGYHVQKFEDAVLQFPDAQVIIASETHYDEIKTNLLNGITPERIVDFAFYRTVRLWEFKDFVEHNHERMLSLKKC